MLTATAVRDAEITQTGQAALASRGFWGRCVRHAWLPGVGLLAAVLCFVRLGDPTLQVIGDEAVYALILDNMVQTGDWISPMVTPNRPHFHKPPLYYWLSALTYEWLPDGMWRYRFWSAIFAVGSVVLTGYIGAKTFRPLVGILAALLFLSNTTFLFHHGARTGAFDAALAFCSLGAVGCYLSLGPDRPWRGWVGMGVCAGAACLFKHPAFGLLPMALLSLYHLAVNRQQAWGRRLIGPLLGLALAAAIAAPWHVAQSWRWGEVFWHEYFGNNVVERATEGLHQQTGQQHGYYVRAVTRSSWGFRLAWLGLGVAALSCVSSWQRSRLLPLVLVAAGHLLLISLAADKAIRYAYPVFPILSLLSAAAFVRLLPELWGPAGAIVMRRVRLTFVALLGILIATDLARAGRELLEPLANTPYLLHERLHVHLETDQCQLLLYQYPQPQQRFRHQHGYTHTDLFFAPRLHEAQRIDTPAELRRWLDQGRPTFVLFGPAHQPTQVLQQAGLTDTTFVQYRANSGYLHPYQIIALHGGEALVAACRLDCLVPIR